MAETCDTEDDGYNNNHPISKRHLRDQKQSQELFAKHRFLQASLIFQFITFVYEAVTKKN